METAKKKTPMPIIAGSLAIASGGLKLLAIFGLFIASFFIIYTDLPNIGITPALFLTIALSLTVIEIVAIVGGISAIKRKHFSLALAGSIMAFLPFSLLGLTSIILLALSKDEFNTG